ncbi:MAG: helicase-related protein [Geminicoccaceae bacterium]|nr:DEAD/DEAH box helicase [Geminicoccaceae bacterium]MDW8124788.1 helicase-related protein [Geminicoccaceae bacterium]
MDEPAGPRWSPGTLVSARGREWIVTAADPEHRLLELRPLSGADGARAGILVDLRRERIVSARFPLPEPARAGDVTGLGALFTASRLLLRAAAAPLRGLGAISFVPRPYQYVPLLLALRQEGPIRLLIADDVGVGKTIEALLVARELLARGLAHRVGVLAPAHLVDQWARELEEKFALPTDRIRPATMAELERRLPRPDASVWEASSCFVASIDFVKSERQRERFLRAAPDLVIVDEAHGCARPRGAKGRDQQQRYELLRDLVRRRDEIHLILVTATPHAGIEESFRSLLGLLRREFDGDGRLDRRRLLPYVVQRRRRDVAHWLGAETPFPERKAREVTYGLDREARALFEKVLDFCRERVSRPDEARSARQRVRHWAAIALLRCVLSSPRAAAIVLGRRGGLEEPSSDEDDPETVDLRFRPELADAIEEEAASDLAPSAPIESAEAIEEERERRRWRELASAWQRLEGPRRDAKLATAIAELRDLLARGFSPVVFCRYIPTAAYVAEALRTEFPDLAVAAVTGELPDELRREKIEELARAPKRVLVATDCLSEGINLQDHFDAVLHYDLPWNPNRLEQREGRIDRFGQKRPEVETVVLYGRDNEVDLVVLEVLIRKARTIRSVLGVAVPVPVGAEEVLEAVVSSVLLRKGGPHQLALDFGDEATSGLRAAWDRAVEAEKETRTYFAQSQIDPDAVHRELAAVDDVLAGPADLERFLRDVLPRFGGRLAPADRSGGFLLHPGDGDRRLAALLGDELPVKVCFDRLADPQALFLGRTHPFVEALASRVVARAMASESEPFFSRCGALRTDRVARITALLLLRLRYRLVERGAERFAEEVRVVAAELDEEDRLAFLEPLDRRGRALLEEARPLAPEPTAYERRTWLERFLSAIRARPDWHAPVTRWRVAELEEAHRRIRVLEGARGRLEVHPHSPPDVLALAVLLPAFGAGR